MQEILQNATGLVASAAGIITMAIVVQYLVQRLKIVYEPIYKKVAKSEEVPGWIDVLFAYGLSFILTFTAGLDIFPILGIPLAVPYLGTAFTAILGGSGSRGLHDLLGAISAGGEDNG